MTIWTAFPRTFLAALAVPGATFALTTAVHAQRVELCSKQDPDDKIKGELIALTDGMYTVLTKGGRKSVRQDDYLPCTVPAGDKDKATLPPPAVIPAGVTPRPAAPAQPANPDKPQPASAIAAPAAIPVMLPFEQPRPT